MASTRTTLVGILIVVTLTIAGATFLGHVAEKLSQDMVAARAQVESAITK